MATHAKATTETVPVTVESFIRAETDMYFRAFSQGKIGTLIHHREPATAENQKVVRDNPNVIATLGVFDLDAGPVTLTLPDSGERFMSLMITNEDHYTSTNYDAGEQRLTREDVGTRYVFIGIRILVDPNDPDDLTAAHALQDAITLDQPGGPGTLDLPDWDKDSQKVVRDALTCARQAHAIVLSVTGGPPVPLAKVAAERAQLPLRIAVK